MWALLVVGGGAGFIGLIFVLTSLRHWLMDSERNVALLLVPIGLASILIGSALLVMTTLLIAALVIFGAFGYVSLPVSELPNVDFPTIVVSASLPGADPQTVASSIP